MRNTCPGGLASLMALVLMLLALSQFGAVAGHGVVDVLLLAAALFSMRFPREPVALGVLIIWTLLMAVLLMRPAAFGQNGSQFWLAVSALALLAVVSVQRLAALARPLLPASVVAGLFGLWILYFWQLLVTAFAVPQVLLPAPLDIARAMYDNGWILAGDFVQTVMKSVLIGYLLGSGLGIIVGLLIDRMPFLQRGLLPLANLTSTIPLVGVAPIAVMWFGFDWPSKAAVIVLVTFFPALVSTLAGLAASGKLEQELMYCYAATPGRTLWVLRLPVALPYIFNALKVNATLALISAIVAEYFGSPTAGLGFRISTEAARMHMSIVWGAIVVASVVGSGVYAILARLDRRVNFWHPSVRGE